MAQHPKKVLGCRRATIGCKRSRLPGWIFEQNGRRVHRAVLVNAGNDLMCVVIFAVITSHRLSP